MPNSSLLTTHLNLIMPLYNEYADIDDINNNMQVIDNSVYDLQQNKIDKPTQRRYGTFLQIDENGDMIWGSPASVAVIQAAAEAWMNEHVSQGQTLAVDSSLLLSGYAADAKSTGDRISEIQSAVEEELSDTNSAIIQTKKYIGLEEISLTIGAYIQTNVASVDPTTPVSNSGCAYAVIVCRHGDEFSVRGTGASFAYAYTFINSSGTILTYNQTVSSLTRIVAPEGAAKLVINCLLQYEHEFYKGDYIKSRVDDLEGTVADESGVIKIKYTYMTKIDTSGSTINPELPTRDTGMSSAVVDCQSGDKFTIYGTGAYSNHACAFIDSNGAKISSTQTFSAPTLITAPDGAVKLVSNVFHSSPYALYKGAFLKFAVNDLIAEMGTVQDVVDEKFKFADGIEFVQFTDGAYIKTDGTTVNVSSPISDANFAYAVIPCSVGDKFTILAQGASYANAYCFIDNSGNKYASKTSQPTKDVITAPANATKLVVNVITLYDNFCAKGEIVGAKLEAQDDKIDKLINEFEKITGNEEIFYTTGAYIRTDGQTVDPTSPTPYEGFAYAVTECLPGDLFTIWGVGGSYAAACCFIDNSGNVISRTIQFDTPTVVTTPENATKLVSTVIVYYDYGFYKGALVSSSIKYLLDTTSTWLGKTVATFGDSITWYNGHEFGESHSEAGQIAVGYQHYLESLGINIVNKGESGYRMDQILGVIKNSNIASYDAVTITCGANDFRYPTIEPLGEIAPIGSTFNEGTMIGALQASIEWLLTQKPSLQIFLITPIKGWSYGNVMPETYPKAFLDVGKLYSLPVCDWYYQSGINDLNKTTFIGDDDTQTHYNLHPTNEGFRLMGQMLKGFFQIR